MAKGDRDGSCGGTPKRDGSGKGRGNSSKPGSGGGQK